MYVISISVIITYFVSMCSFLHVQIITRSQVRYLPLGQIPIFALKNPYWAPEIQLPVNCQKGKQRWNPADDARFLQVSNDDTNQFIDEMKNNSTKKKKIKLSETIIGVVTGGHWAEGGWGHTSSGAQSVPGQIFCLKDHRNMRNMSPAA